MRIFVVLATLVMGAAVSVAVGPVSGAAASVGRIAYGSDVAGSYDIWTRLPDGSGAVQVTSEPGEERHPTWSPDGTEIAYVNGSSSIHIVDADGAGVPGPAIRSGISVSSLDWSPDGASIVFAEFNLDTSSYDVSVVNVDGTGYENLTDPLPGPSYQEGDPVWSPDGTKVAFLRTGSGTSDVWLLEFATGDVQQLTFDGGAKSRLEWLPDGSAVSYSPTSGFLSYVNVSDLSVTSLGFSVGSGGYDWSPDGTQLAYAGGVADLFVRTLGGTQVNVTASGERVFYPEWEKPTGGGGGIGTLVIDVVTEPATAPFTYSYSGVFSGEGPIGHGDGTLSVEVVPGAYSVRQSPNPVGWGVADVTCVESGIANSYWDEFLDRRRAVFAVEAGETVTCTYTNRDVGLPKFPELPVDNPFGAEFVVTQVRPDDDMIADAADVTFDVTVEDNWDPYDPDGPLVAVCTADRADGRPVPSLLTPDPVTGEVTASFAVGVTHVTCSAEDDTGNVGTRVFQVQVNGWTGEIRIIKQTYPPGLEATFSFTGELSGDLSHGDAPLTVDVEPNEPGAPYVVIELATPGWAVASMACDDADSGRDPSGSDALHINVGAGETVTCTSVSTPVSPIAWGRNTLWQLGEGVGGSNRLAAEPQFMNWVPPEEIVQFGLGRSQTSFFLLSDGTVWALGRGNTSGLGITTGNQTPPEQVSFEEPSGSLAAATVTTLGFAHAFEETIFAATAEGELWGWGRNGSAGRARIPGSTDSWVYEPVRVEGPWSAGDPIVAIDGDDGVVWVTSASGVVYAWGSPRMIPGADPSGAWIAEPVEVTLGTPAGVVVSKVVASNGNGHYYALLSDGTVLAWGLNDDVSGSLLGVGEPPVGAGSNIQRTPTPVLVDASTPLTSVVDVGANRVFGLALLDDGSVWSWGGDSDGDGPPVLGDGTTRRAPFAIPTVFSAGVVEIAAAESTGAVKLANGELWGWGESVRYYGLDGGTGTGLTSSVFVPVHVGNLSEVDVWAISGWGGMATGTAPPSVPAPFDGAYSRGLTLPVVATTDHAGTGATEDDPIETTVRRNQPGFVTIQEVQHDPLMTGFEIAGLDLNSWQVDINVEGADAPADDPMEIEFRLYTGLFGIGPFTVAVLEDGATSAYAVPACDDPAVRQASPEPRCIAAQVLDGNEWVITVYATHASRWAFGVENPVANPGGPYSGEAGSIVLDATGSSTPSGGPLTYTWLAEPGLLASPEADTTQYLGTEVGLHRVHLIVEDQSGRADIADAEIEVLNTGPVLDALNISQEPTPVGGQVAIAGTFSDPNLGDTHAATIDWGDGTSTAAAVGTTAANYAVEGSHTYGQPGVYEVTVFVADNWGATDAATARYVVVYDPDGGFASGGGWIIPGGGSSDPGDLLPGVDGSSKANFGFVVKYQNGASTVPGGNLTFHYNVGGFKLRSTEMEWLVVTNANWAKFQGSATITGQEGTYPFRVDARDGTADRFVIKIYAPGADPSSADPIYKASGDLGGGDVKIHSG